MCRRNICPWRRKVLRSAENILIESSFRIRLTSRQNQLEYNFIFCDSEKKAWKAWSLKKKIKSEIYYGLVPEEPAGNDGLQAQVTKQQSSKLPSNQSWPDSQAHRDWPGGSAGGPQPVWPQNTPSSHLPAFLPNPPTLERPLGLNRRSAFIKEISLEPEVNAVCLSSLKGHFWDCFLWVSTS